MMMLLLLLNVLLKLEWLVLLLQLQLLLQLLLLQQVLLVLLVLQLLLVMLHLFLAQQIVEERLIDCFRAVGIAGQPKATVRLIHRAERMVQRVTRAAVLLLVLHFHVMSVERMMMMMMDGRMIDSCCCVHHRCLGSHLQQIGELAHVDFRQPLELLLRGHRNRSGIVVGEIGAQHGGGML